MKLKLSLLLALILVAGCSSASDGKLSKTESCREALRLMGKTTDQIMSKVGESSINLIGVAQEFRNLALNTEDQTLSASIDRISQSLKKMSSDATFFEGNSMYLAEITTITGKCS